VTLNDNNLFAIVGLGNISNRHRKNLKYIFPSAKIACLPSSGKYLDSIPKNSDILCSTIDELILLRPSFVIIASPATFHAQHSVPFIKNKIPVLIEKPIAASMKDAMLISSAAKKYKTPVAIGYCLRYKLFIDEVKDILYSKMIGDINEVNIVCSSYLPNWRPNIDFQNSVSASAELGGGALLELSHEIDYANFLLKELSLDSATIKNSGTLGIEVEDCVDLIFTLPKGGRCKMHLDFLKKNPIRMASFNGSDGKILWDLENNSLHINARNLQESKVDENWDQNNMYKDMLLDFSSNFSRHKENKLCTVAEATNVLKFIEEAHQLGDTGSNE